MDESRRPWGYYDILLESASYKVKRILVYPAKRLSLQYHLRRSERWVVLQGEGVVTRNADDIPVRSGDAVEIPVGTSHRIANTGSDDLIFIEVQHGDYFGEDDIVRLQDDFGRLPSSTDAASKKDG
jgi:mannose-6-phosphate isomerase